ncbi:hypothetical protein [Alkalitalea saponilacus]|uniref:Uncharacterized protein n=1 Tax=Alkalitalea saponilacus TaxID=889453 RepID=A0A1T5GMW3_9BACT|nr:hypothetical protein [Alkalitalea saponilacus]SKC09698.1 hypothetical protein SAMN03080601_01878 [Alkalitalea saponilacus]
MIKKCELCPGATPGADGLRPLEAYAISHVIPSYTITFDTSTPK